jgi:hypothetical protein
VLITDRDGPHRAIDFTLPARNTFFRVDSHSTFSFPCDALDES